MGWRPEIGLSLNFQVLDLKSVVSLVNKGSGSFLHSQAAVKESLLYFAVKFQLIVSVGRCYYLSVISPKQETSETKPLFSIVAPQVINIKGPGDRCIFLKIKTVCRAALSAF